ncbi:MAG: CDP-alcohol phosphatidyltransferase family protein [Candidatus Micrarchaeota archaeon]
MMKASFPELAEKISIKLGIALARIPLSPNAWTVLSIVPAIFGFAALYYQHLPAAIALFAFSAVIDAVDGGVARVTGRVTNLGAYLDGMADRIVEALLLFGLFFYGMPDFYVSYAFWLALLLFVGTCMVSFSRAYADHRKVITDSKKLSKMGGILERAERIILVFLGMLAAYFAGVPIYLTYAIVAACILSILTLAQRIYFVVKNAE